MGKDGLQKVDVGHNSVDHKLLQGGLYAPDGGGTVLGVDDQLGQQRVVEMGHLTACCEARIDPDAGAARLDKLQELAGARQKSAGRVFGVDAALDGMAALAEMDLFEGEALPACDADLPVDQVQAGDQLGDRMLDLQAGVHLEEIEFVRVGVDDELDGAGVVIIDGFCRGDRSISHLLPQLRREQRRGRLFDDLLMPSLDGAFPLE